MREMEKRGAEALEDYAARSGMDWERVADVACLLREKGGENSLMAVGHDPRKPQSSPDHANAANIGTGSHRHAGQSVGDTSTDDTSAHRLNDSGNGSEALRARVGFRVLGRPGHGLSVHERGFDPDCSRETQLEDIQAAMRSNPWLSSVPPEEAEALARASHRRVFAAKEVLLDARNRREGQLFLVLRGEVTVVERQDTDARRSALLLGGTDPEKREGKVQAHAAVGQGGTFGLAAGIRSLAQAAGLTADWEELGEEASDEAEWAVLSGLAHRAALSALGASAGVLLVLERAVVARVLAPLLRERRLALLPTLRSIPALASLPDGALRRLADSSRAESARPGEALHRADARSLTLRIIVSGAAIVVFVCAPQDGGTVRLRTVREGAVGLAAALERRASSVGAVAGREEVRMLAIEARAVARELLAADLFATAVAAARMEESGDEAAGARYLERRRAVAGLLQQVTGLASALETLHLRLWTPLQGSTYLARNRRNVCEMLSTLDALLPASHTLCARLETCLLDTPTLSLAIARASLSAWAACASAWVARLRIATAAFSRALTAPAFLALLLQASSSPLPPLPHAPSPPHPPPLAHAQPSDGEARVREGEDAEGGAHGGEGGGWGTHVEQVLEAMVSGERCAREAAEHLGRLAEETPVTHCDGRWGRELTAAQASLHTALAGLEGIRDHQMAALVRLQARLSRPLGQWRARPAGACLEAWEALPPHRRLLLSAPVKLLPSNARVRTGAEQAFGDEATLLDGPAGRTPPAACIPGGSIRGSCHWLCLFNDLVLLCEAEDAGGWSGNGECGEGEDGGVSLGVGALRVWHAWEVGSVVALDAARSSAILPPDFHAVSLCPVARKSCSTIPVWVGFGAETGKQRWLAALVAAQALEGELLQDPYRVASRITNCPPPRTTMGPYQE